MSDQIYEDYEDVNTELNGRNFSYRKRNLNRNKNMHFNENPSKNTYFVPRSQYLNGNSSDFNDRRSKYRKRNHYQNQNQNWNQNRNRNRNQNTSQQMFSHSLKSMPIQDIRKLSGTQFSSHENEHYSNAENERNGKYEEIGGQLEYKKDQTIYEPNTYEYQTETEEQIIVDEYYTEPCTDEIAIYEENIETTYDSNYLQFDKKAHAIPNPIHIQSLETSIVSEKGKTLKSDTNMVQNSDLIMNSIESNADLFMQIKCAECILDYIKDIEREKYISLEKELSKFCSELKLAILPSDSNAKNAMMQNELVLGSMHIRNSFIKHSPVLKSKPTRPPMKVKKSYPVKPPFLHANIKPLVSLSVKIPHNLKTDVIQIWNGDDIKQISKGFCGKHGMMHNQEIVYNKLKELLNSVREKHKNMCK